MKIITLILTLFLIIGAITTKYSFEKDKTLLTSVFIFKSKIQTPDFPLYLNQKEEKDTITYSLKSYFFPFIDLKSIVLTKDDFLFYSKYNKKFSVNYELRSTEINKDYKDVSKLAIRKDKKGFSFDLPSTDNSYENILKIVKENSKNYSKYEITKEKENTIRINLNNINNELYKKITVDILNLYGKQNLMNVIEPKIFENNDIIKAKIVLTKDKIHNLYIFFNHHDL